MQGAISDEEALDFESEDDDLMDEDDATNVDVFHPPAPPLPKLKFTIIGGASSSLSADCDRTLMPTAIAILPALVSALLPSRVVLDFNNVSVDVLGVVDKWAARFFGELEYLNAGENGNCFADMMWKDLPQKNQKQRSKVEHYHNEIILLFMRASYLPMTKAMSLDS